MPEYIEHERAKEHLNGDYAYAAAKLLDDIPAADVVEVVHGYWKDTEYGTCSVCDRSINEIFDADSSMTTGILLELSACPFCGAKMDGERSKE